MGQRAGVALQECRPGEVEADDFAGNPVKARKDWMFPSALAKATKAARHKRALFQLRMGVIVLSEGLLHGILAVAFDS